MSEHLWIESLQVTGDEVEPSIINFAPGLNVIHGPSDTGKTYLAKTIKYMLAGSTRPFPPETGYTKIRMVLRSSEGKVALSRQIGSSKITVHADRVFAVPVDEFAANNTDANPTGYTVSDLLLRMIGVREERVVITNQYGGRKKLAWKNLSDTLHRGEGRVTAEESIFTTNKHAALSAFLTLFYDQDLSTISEHEDPAEQGLRKRILVPHINDQITFYEKRIGELADELGDEPAHGVDEQLRALSKELETLSTKQNDARTRLAELTVKISDSEKDLAADRLTAAKYDDLATVYVGNIKRLTFAAGVQEVVDEMPTPLDCPFCGSELEDHDHDDLREAAQAEADAIISDLQALTEVQSTLADKINSQEQTLVGLRRQQEQIETQLSQQLMPEITKSQVTIAALRAYQEKVAEKDMLEQYRAALGDELEDVLDPEEPKAAFHPADQFPDSFYTDMTAYVRHVLTEAHYADAERAYFDKETFDIRVGRKAKRSHGKGYRAFFNTVTLLALRRYIHEHAAHKPTIVVIDTPTLGLEHQKSGRNLVTSRDEQGRPVTGLLRNLFDYMIDTGDQGQLIILNNTDATPASTFDAECTMELVFGEEDDADRPGFLAEIREEGDATPQPEQPEGAKDEDSLFPAKLLEQLE